MPFDGGVYVLAKAKRGQPASSVAALVMRWVRLVVLAQSARQSARMGATIHLADHLARLVEP
jgi:hypothetical protein